MSARHHYTLECDHVFVDAEGNVLGDCIESFPGGPRADVTRRLAAREGWVHYIRPAPSGPSASGDLCPAHAKLLPEGARVLPIFDSEAYGGRAPRA